MYERFSSESRQVLVTASADARAFGQAMTGTEHLLLALTKVDAWVSDLLVGHGVTHDAVSGVLPHRSGPSGSTGRVPLTLDCRRALELASALADLEGDGRVQPHHLLLGVLDVGGGAAGVLIALEVKAERLRQAIDEVAGPIGPHLAPGDPPDVDVDLELGAGAVSERLDVPVGHPWADDPAVGTAAAPRCPGCQQPLEGELAGWSRPVAGRPGVGLVIVSCRSCGHILATSVERRGPEVRDL